MAKLTFLGAAGCVTGSRYVVEANNKKLLVDCGLFQGTRELKERNWKPLTIRPETIDYTVLTHAHLDHTGWLPKFVKDGYAGPIFANAATMELTEILLKDSAHLQEEDALHAQEHRYSRHPNPQALYVPEDVGPVLKLMKEMPRAGMFQISPAFRIVSYDAGHIIGSSTLELTVTENGKKTVVVFSGDIGRYGEPILKDPATPPNADFLLCESTYGDRDHPPGPASDGLADAVNKVVKRGGCMVIPAFAVGRTQTLMYYFRLLQSTKRIPEIPVYIDSPMAVSATTLYIKHTEDHDAEFRKAAAGGRGNALNVRGFHLATTAEESKHINNVNTPCIIISASGMATGGRVLHHLKRRLPDPRNAVLIVGFQAEGTRGRALLERAKTLRIHGEDVPVNAEIIELRQFSAHAGRSELLRWLNGFSAAPKRTFLVHGEPVAAQSLQGDIAGRGWNVQVARYLDSVELNS